MNKPQNLNKITITKSHMKYRPCESCGCVTLHIGNEKPASKVGSMYQDCIQCLVDAHDVPGLSRWIDPKTNQRLTKPRGKKPPKSEI